MRPNIKRSLTLAAAMALSFSSVRVMGNRGSSLSLEQAHEAALKNHPQIRVGDLKALAALQVTRQVRSGFFPTLSANVMTVGAADENTRLGAVGGLNNPLILNRNAEGLVLSLLITDFGRTANLTGSARLRAQAEAENAQATREQILLAVDASFFAAQQAQAVTEVAERTVATRQLFLDQVTALATNKLRSDLDVSFARVNVEDGKLLLSKAQNDLQAEFTRLANLMGMREPQTWQLVQEPAASGLSTNIAELVEQALRLRPELLSLRDSREAAVKFARAEKALHYPTVSAIGSAGVIPVGDSELPQNYAAGGISITLPLYVGGLYSARQQEAQLRVQAEEERLRDLENNVVRDVRIAWLNAQNALDRLRITGQLLDNTKQSFNLAQARYQNGISSIVEFNQAQLNLLSAQISYANTQYEYLLQRSALEFQTGSLR
jgi:outer membrane protein